ncbi:hypothetical protein [Aliagarivorans taiwanensis]|uniref:hypothetical protein n=1 Tax=Aliagarivorans taiwanensis TaxID=561966 RepID=UPI0003FAECDA|nr:hypothetical protein [Aliagarivorans taiwanensis]
MNLLRWIMSCCLVVVLSACGGGHGYEGTYQNNMLGIVSELEIGKNYLMSDGEKQKVDKISVEKRGGDEYLVFVTDGQREEMRIADRNTLVIDLGIVEMVWTRTK